MITKGFGKNQKIITKGFGFKNIVQVVRRQYLRMVSRITKTIEGISCLEK